MTTTREEKLEAALKLARNRLQACAIDHQTGSREMAERSEWANEATAALSTPATEPQGYVEGLEAAREFIAQDILQWDEETFHENTSPEEAAQYIRDLNIPASRPSFVTAVMKRLRRFHEITEDVEGTGVDIGRDWLDALTLLGLLERVRKSPASWQLTDAAMQALAARPAPQPAADTRVVTPQEAAQILYDTMTTNRPIFDAMVEAAEDIELTGVSFNRVVGDALRAAIAWDAPAIIGTATPAPSDKIAEAAIDRCMEEIEDIICEADVSYPAGRDAGTSIDFDRDAVLAALRALAGKGE